MKRLALGAIAVSALLGVVLWWPEAVPAGCSSCDARHQRLSERTSP